MEVYEPPAIQATPVAPTLFDLVLARGGRRPRHGENHASQRLPKKMQTPQLALRPRVARPLIALLSPFSITRMPIHTKQREAP